jgi:hypothetical protein
MISDVLSDAVSSLEEFEADEDNGYGDIREEIAKVKVEMLLLQASLDLLPEWRLTAEQECITRMIALKFGGSRKAFNRGVETARRLFPRNRTQATEEEAVFAVQRALDLFGREIVQQLIDEWERVQQLVDEAK